MSDGSDRLFYEFGAFRIDVAERLLLRGGEVVPLTPKAFDTLLVLVERSGRLVEKDELMRRLWPDTFVEEANLAHNISLLRKAFGDGAGDSKFIQTVPRRGYRWLAGVEERREAEKQSRADETPSPARPQAFSDSSLAQSLAGRTAEVNGRKEKTDGESNDSEDASAQPSPVSPPAQVRGRVIPARLFAAVALAAIAVVAVVLLLKTRSGAPPLKITPLTSYAGRESQPAFSPDGSQIAFVWRGEKGDNADIYVKLVDAGTPLRLTTDPATDTDPVWSPDGHYIAFLRSTSNSRALMVVPALGGPERKITDLRPAVIGGRISWSPDGKTFAVAEQDDSPSRCSIFLVSYDTGEERRLTTPPAEDTGDGKPAFSPDGQTVAFVRVGHFGVSEIYLQPVAGGEARQLTFDKNNIGTLAWTPDGREILFTSDRGGSFESDRLWRMSITGGEAALVTGVEDHIASFAISLRGDRLAYEQQSVDANVWRVELQGTSAPVSPPVELIASTRWDFQQQYSPDGSRIAFGSDRSGNFEIWTCASDGSNPIQVTSFGGPMAGTPRWSPDGKQIVFDARAGGNADIYAIKATGGTPRRLTTEDSEDVVPSWSADGRWIYFASNRSGAWQVWRMPAEGGAAEQVTREGGFAPRPSPDGEFIYYTKEPYKNGPLWRVPAKGGAEEIIPGFTKQTWWPYWTVTSNGIYFGNTAPGPQRPIEFFDLKTGQFAPILTLEKPRAAGLTVSPDGRWLLYAQVDRNDSDLMLADNFK